jgi:hypothetical protein
MLEKAGLKILLLSSMLFTGVSRVGLPTATKITSATLEPWLVIQALNGRHSLGELGHVGWSIPPQLIHLTHLLFSRINLVIGDMSLPLSCQHYPAQATRDEVMELVDMNFKPSQNGTVVHQLGTIAKIDIDLALLVLIRHPGESEKESKKCKRKGTRRISDLPGLKRK